MLMTSDYAQKMIKKLEEEKTLLVSQMSRYSTFIVSIGEGEPDDLRPEFDFKATVAQIEDINQKIIKIRHARNMFNSTTEIEGTGMTVDMALIQMPILNKEASKYIGMGNVQPKERNRSYNDTVEYTYTNYDIAYAKEIGEAKQEELMQLQEKLNLLNSTITFEVDI